MAKLGPNSRSVWQREARLLRLKGMEVGEIATKLDKPRKLVRSVCAGVKPGTNLDDKAEKFFREYGIRITQVERLTFGEKGGQPSLTTIPMPRISIIADHAEGAL